MTKRPIVLLVVAGVLAAGCSSSDDATTATPATDAPATNAAPLPTTAPPGTEPLTTAPPAAPATIAPPTTAPATIVPSTAVPPASATDEGLALLDALASDELRGRQNLSAELEAARGLVLGFLRSIAEPIDPAAAGDAGYLQTFELGTNVLAVIPGTELPDEYVMVGAHLDHLGSGDADGECRGVTPEDEICNGAADNATGVAAALSVAARLAADPPRRSVIVAIWDAEEDGLQGSFAYVTDPLVPLDRIVTYVNFDIQGAWLLPSMADDTVVVGAETGGPALVDLVDTVTGASSLDYASLSLLFGQGRSDHAPFAAAEVPVVFFTDANNGCYHTVDDELVTVDRAKLAEQARVAGDLVVALADGDAPVAFDGAAPVTTFTDAERLLALVRDGEPDLDALDPALAGTVAEITDMLQSVVDAGADAYDRVAEGTVLGGAALLVQFLGEDVPCSFVTPPG